MYCNYLLEYREYTVLVKNSSFLNFDKVKLKRKSRNETHKIYGDMVLYEDLSNDIEALFELYEKQGGEYRKSVFKFKSNACDAIEMDKVFWPSLADALEPKMPIKCDIPAGTYTFNGYIPDTTNIPPMMLRSGDYMVLFKLLRNGEILQGSENYVHMINIKGGFIGL